MKVDILAQALQAEIDANGNRALAARNLGIPRKTLCDRLEIAQRQNILCAPSSSALTPEQKLKNENFELKAQLKSVRADTITDDWVREKIGSLIDNVRAAEVPQWTTTVKRGIGSPGIPTSFWSDWHWAERVFPSQIGGVNEYDLAIAHKRVKKLVERTIHLLRNDVVNPNYEGIVIALGGDMLSGDIHDELAQTNEMPLMQALVDLHSVLVWALKTMADEFGNVFVPCVTGNHGRNTKKMQAKNRNFTNFDWLLYQFLRNSFKHDPRIQFLIPDGPDAHYAVCGHKFLLTHGDQFYGGDGEVGMFGPVIRGMKRKQSRNANIGREFDTMIIGHWHQYTPTMRVIVNGSLKGYDEYANSRNFGFERPIQALWLTHPERGITSHRGIPVDEDRKNEDQSYEWVTLRKAA